MRSQNNISLRIHHWTSVYAVCMRGMVIIMGNAIMYEIKATRIARMYCALFLKNKKLLIRYVI